MISVLILTLNDYGISLNLDILSIRDYRLPFFMTMDTGMFRGIFWKKE